MLRVWSWFALTILLRELCLWLRYALDSQIFWRSGLPVICCSKPNYSNTDFMERNISIMQNTELSFVFMQNHSHLRSCLSWVAWNNLFCDNLSFCVQCISKHGKSQSYRCNAFQIRPNTDVTLIFAIELLLHKSRLEEISAVFRELLVSWKKASF